MPIGQEIKSNLRFIWLNREQREECRRQRQVQLLQDLNSRCSFLQQAAIEYISPYILQLRRLGIREVLEELSVEKRIGETVDTTCWLKYFFKGEDKQFHEEMLRFDGDPPKCSDWKHIRPFTLDDFGKQHLQAFFEVNSIEPQGKRGFRVSYLSSKLCWEGKRARDHSYFPARAFITPTHYIEFIWDSSGGTLVDYSTVFYESPRDRNPYEIVKKGNRTTPLQRDIWGNKDLLRKIIAEAYSRQSQIYQ